MEDSASAAKEASFSSDAPSPSSAASEVAIAAVELPVFHASEVALPTTAVSSSLLPVVLNAEVNEASPPPLVSLSAEHDGDKEKATRPQDVSEAELNDVDRGIDCGDTLLLNSPHEQEKSSSTPKIDREEDTAMIQSSVGETEAEEALQTLAGCAEADLAALTEQASSSEVSDQELNQDSNRSNRVPESVLQSKASASSSSSFSASNTGEAEHSHDEASRLLEVEPAITKAADDGPAKSGAGNPSGRSDVVPGGVVQDSILAEAENADGLRGIQREAGAEPLDGEHPHFIETVKDSESAQVEETQRTAELQEKPRSGHILSAAVLQLEEAARHAAGTARSTPGTLADDEEAEEERLPEVAEMEAKSMETLTPAEAPSTLSSPMSHDQVAVKSGKDPAEADANHEDAPPTTPPSVDVLTSPPVNAAGAGRKRRRAPLAGPARSQKTRKDTLTDGVEEPAAPVADGVDDTAKAAATETTPSSTVALTEQAGEGTVEEKDEAHYQSADALIDSPSAPPVEQPTDVIGTDATATSAITVATRGARKRAISPPSASLNLQAVKAAHHGESSDTTSTTASVAASVKAASAPSPSSAPAASSTSSSKPVLNIAGVNVQALLAESSDPPPLYLRRQRRTRRKPVLAEDHPLFAEHRDLCQHDQTHRIIARAPCAGDAEVLNSLVEWRDAPSLVYARLLWRYTPQPFLQAAMHGFETMAAVKPEPKVADTEAVTVKKEAEES